MCFVRRSPLAVLVRKASSAASRGQQTAVSHIVDRILKAGNGCGCPENGMFKLCSTRGNARRHRLPQATHPNSRLVLFFSLVFFSRGKQATWLQDGLDSGNIILVPNAKASRVDGMIVVSLSLPQQHGFPSTRIVSPAKESLILPVKSGASTPERCTHEVDTCSSYPEFSKVDRVLMDAGKATGVEATVTPREGGEVGACNVSGIEFAVFSQRAKRFSSVLSRKP